MFIVHTQEVVKSIYKTWIVVCVYEQSAQAQTIFEHNKWLKWHHIGCAARRKEKSSERAFSKRKGIRISFGCFILAEKRIIINVPRRQLECVVAATTHIRLCSHRHYFICGEFHIHLVFAFNFRDIFLIRRVYSKEANHKFWDCAKFNQKKGQLPK